MKKFCLLLILACGLATTAQSKVTYNLKTHIDRRTITGTATISAGSDLLDAMPKDLWRGFCTYKFYADAELTEEITTAPSADATVYVDYDFDPPFLVSTANDVKWLYFKNFPSSTSGTSDARYIYYQQSGKGIYNQKGLTTSSTKLKVVTDAQWAFEGDAYSLSVRYNDVNNNTTYDYMIPGGTSADAAVKLSAKQSLGWQVYKNTASGSLISDGYFALVRPDNNYMLAFDYVGAQPGTRSLSSENLTFDAHNNIVATNKNYNKNLFYSAFVATPVADGGSATSIWHATYKIIMGYQNYEQRGDDIVVTKPNNSTAMPALPDQYKLENYKYTYYKDAALTQQWDDVMPTGCNTVVYVLEEPNPISATLAEIESEGDVNTTYAVSDALVGVFAKDNVLYAKDNAESVNIQGAREGEECLKKYFNDAVWTENNWVILDFSNTGAEAGIFVGVELKAGSVVGTYTDDVNYTLKLTEVPEAGNDCQYTKNIVTPANFASINWDGVTVINKLYWFMNPKPCEVVKVRWAVWDGTKFNMPEQEKYHIAGEININWDLNQDGDQTENLKNKIGKDIVFDAVILRSTAAGSAPSLKAATATDSGLIAQPLNLNAHSIVTAIENINSDIEKTVKAVRVYNVNGVEQRDVQAGVNIIVTTYSDGSTSTSKIIR